MVRPRALRPGDKVALVSPASPFDRTEFEAGVAELRRLGYEPVYEESIFAREPMVSGAPSVRAAAFRNALRDPSVRAIIAVRGGYGSVEILPYLDPSELRESRTIICGYSDITSLLVYSVCHAGLVALHGPMIDRRLSRGRAGYEETTFAAAIDGRPLGALRPDGLSVLQPGSARGTLIGGTITQLAASLGTPYALTLDRPAILFVEDVNERPYRLRRMLVQLKLAGVLEHVTGVVLGAMIGCDEGDLAACDAVSALFRDVIDFRGPVLAGFPSGHGDAPTWTLPFGVEASMTTEDGGALVIDEPAAE